jgi:hypothetical protein
MVIRRRRIDFDKVRECIPENRIALQQRSQRVRGALTLRAGHPSGHVEVVHPCGPDQAAKVPTRVLPEQRRKEAHGVPLSVSVCVLVSPESVCERTVMHRKGKRQYKGHIPFAYVNGGLSTLIAASELA